MAQATVSSYPVSYTTSGSLRGTNYQNAIGKGADTASASGNDYCSSRNSYAYVYYSFDFSSIPNNANIISVECQVKGHAENTSQSSERARCQLYVGTSTEKGSYSDFTSTTTQTLTLTTGTWTYEEVQDMTLCFTMGYYGGLINGATVTVTYELSDPRTITTTLSGNGIIDPNSTQMMYDGDEYNLIIVPTNENDTVTATNNGSSVTLTVHTGSESISVTADSLTTGFSGGSNMAFYTSSSSTGHNFNYAIDHTVESPGSTSSGSGSWTYVKDNGSSTNYTGYADFSFDFSSIPEGSTINSITVKCYGATESTSESTAHSEITLYSGTTQKSTSQKFTSTSNSTITISSPGTWTRTELQSAKLRFVVGYYGGHIFGITWTVNYTSPKYYTYSYTVSGDATIAVVIGSGGSSEPKFYIKDNGAWVQVSKIYKKVNGNWVEQASSTWSTLFDTNTNYRRR